MKILIKTLGCKANRADSDRLSEALLSKFGTGAGSGVEVVEVNNASDRVEGPVDFCIINSCTVTHVADRKSRAQIKLFKKNYPDARIIVMGCGPKVDSEEFEKISELEVCVSEEEVLACIASSVESVEEDDGVSGDHRTRGLRTHGFRTRAVLKIQEGCDNFCSYCIIPFARGRERNDSCKSVLASVEKMVSGGCKEIVLTGINIGNWRDGEMDLGDLILKILDETSLARLRLSSIEPQNFGESFEKLLSSSDHSGSDYSGRFCPHMHMSLQSGSDSVLKAMRRGYNTELYKKVAQKMRKLSPDIALTTDVIVGFPGESDEDFETTCAFVRKVGFAKIHVFPYSKRAGTKAALMDGQVTEQEKKIRARKLQTISDEMRVEFLGNQIGKIFPVLIEQRVPGSKGCLWEGFTPNYVKVRVESDDDLTNEIVDVRLDRLFDGDKTKAACIEATLV